MSEKTKNFQSRIESYRNKMVSNITFIICFALLISVTTANEPSDAETFIKSYIRSGNALELGTIKHDTDDFCYEFKNVSAKIQDSVVDDYSVNKKLSVIRVSFHMTIKFYIPRLRLEGNLFSLPVDSEGSGTLTTNVIYFDLVIPYDTTQDCDGNDIVTLKSYDYGYSIRGNVMADLTFDEEELNDPDVKLFLNDVWRIITSKYARPLYGAFCDNIFKAVQSWWN